MSMNDRTAARPFVALLGAAGFGLALGLATTMGIARAASPLPYDYPEPPPNINVALIYSQFASSDSFYTAHGTKVGDTSINTVVPILRYVHTFTPIDGVGYGFQVIAPDINFVGNPKIGGADLSSNSGFAEPILSAFLFPYSNPAEDETLSLVYFFSPPVGAYDRTRSLNASTNSYVNNFEVAYGHILFGKPKGQRVTLQVWLDAYFYGVNTDGPPLGPYGSHVHTQPVGQAIIYLPYFYHPATDAYVGLSFEQTIGGKAYLSSPLGKIDTGNRNDVSTVGIDTGTFLAPTVFAQASLQSDVRVRGGAKRNVVFQFQIGKIF